MTQWYTYLLAVHTPPGKKGDGFSAFAQSKHLLYCRFDPDGFIYLYTSKDHAIGQYRFVSCREVEEAFPEALWQTKDPCPYVEHVQGYVNWEFWEQYPSINDRVDMVSNWLYISKGRLIHLPTAQYLDAVIQQTFPLEDCWSKWGFYDGDFFLDNDAIYDVYIWDIIKAALYKLGLTPVIKPFGTSHNPFRIHQLENPERSWEIFRKHRYETLLKLWGYNIKAIRGQELKELLTD